MKFTLPHKAYTKQSKLPSQAEQYSQQSRLVNESHECNQLPSYIKHLSQCRLLICRAHRFCLTLGNLSEHLELEHGMSVDQSRLAWRAALELDVAGTRSGITIPPAEAPPIAGLQVDLGFMCTVKPGCPFFSPRQESLSSHLSKHGNRNKRSACFQNVAMQNFFPGKRPLYFAVNTSATTSSTAWGAGYDEETVECTSRDADREGSLIEDDNGDIFPREYAYEQNPSSTRLERGLRPNLEPAPSASPTPFSSSAPSVSPAPSSALARPLAPVNSQSRSQPALISEPTLSLSSNTVFLTRRVDTRKEHICLASDITSPGSNLAVLDPSWVSFGRYCDILRSEQILDQEGKVSLGFEPTGGERISIWNQMMFRTAVAYQVDRNVDMVTFSAAVAVLD